HGALYVAAGLSRVFWEPCKTGGPGKDPRVSVCHDGPARCARCFLRLVLVRAKSVECGARMVSFEMGENAGLGRSAADRTAVPAGGVCSTAPGICFPAVRRCDHPSAGGRACMGTSTHAPPGRARTRTRGQYRNGRRGSPGFGARGISLRIRPFCVAAFVVCVPQARIPPLL